jgi:hypothetical protein
MTIIRIGGNMKDKILIFIIGVLIGAVITTGAFYIYSKTVTCNNTQQQAPGGTPPEKPEGEIGEPPEKPDGESGEPPEKPSE